MNKNQKPGKYSGAVLGKVTLLHLNHDEESRTLSLSKGSKQQLGVASRL